MKWACWLGRHVAIGAFAVLGVACGPKPGIDLLKNPVIREIDGLVIGSKLDGKSRKELKRVGLLDRALSDPMGALREVDVRVSAEEDERLRAAGVDLALTQAFRWKDEQPRQSMGFLVAAIGLSAEGLIMEPSKVQIVLVAAYNEANAELARQLHKQRLAKGERVTVPTPAGERRLGWAAVEKRNANPRFYDSLTPTSRIKVKGFEEQNRREGVGGTIVGYRERLEERLKDDPMMPHPGYAIPLTAIAREGSGGRVDVDLFDAISVDHVEIRGRRYVLAGDYTAAVATIVNASPGSKVGFAGMLRPEGDHSREGLYLLGPHRPDSIPLVLVHGLMSTPDTWRAVVNACYADPVVRKNYQLLVFFYPTGFPIPQNAATLREALKAFQRDYDPGRSLPKMREMVMVGHSMGSNLTNFQIREGGDELWYKFFKKPVDEVAVSDTVRNRADRKVYFKANPDIKRVVFICGPHQGSPLSDSWLGRFGARLIEIPFQAADGLAAGGEDSLTALGNSVLSESSSSINNLRVDSPVLEAILRQPMTYNPPIHSIIGDRGKGGGVNSSDGVVPYWSSHLDYSKSEFFIPASHTQATTCPETSIELRRILHLHIGREFSPVEAGPPQGD